jgi:hypothetical protein
MFAHGLDGAGLLDLAPAFRAMSLDRGRSVYDAVTSSTLDDGTDQPLTRNRWARDGNLGGSQPSRNQ